MNATRYAACLWPGLPELWYRGEWSGLPAAMSFAGALNFLLVSRFIYPEWLQPSLVRIACWVAVGVWIMLVTRSIHRLPALLYPRAVGPGPDPFPRAHRLYLQGSWGEAEGVLAECLQIDARDCQALLLRAAIYRRTERWEAAELTLDLLDRLESADPWGLERERERERLQRAQGGASEAPPT